MLMLSYWGPCLLTSGILESVSFELNYRTPSWYLRISVRMQSATHNIFPIQYDWSWKWQHSSILSWKIPWIEKPAGYIIHKVTKSRTQLKWLSMHTIWHLSICCKVKIVNYNWFWLLTLVPTCYFIFQWVNWEIWHCIGSNLHKSWHHIDVNVKNKQH